MCNILQFHTQLMAKTKQTFHPPPLRTAKTLTECLIEYQDIPVSVYRQRESILRRDPSIWVWENIPPELLLVTARVSFSDLVAAAGGRIVDFSGIFVQNLIEICRFNLRIIFTYYYLLAIV